MTLRLTAPILRAAYAFLRECRPFNRWKLPAPLEVVFTVIKDPTLYGMYECIDGQHVICVSAANVGHIQTLMRTMAHEMVHLRQNLRGMEAEHGRLFKRWAAVVCDTHGFDPVEF